MILNCGRDRSSVALLPFGGARPCKFFILVLFIFDFKVARYARSLFIKHPT
jgi:hypothetical protein